MRRLLISTLLIPLASGCWLFDSTRPAVDPMAGFRAMSVPREDIPIGARWVDGQGPASAAAASDNILVLRSLTTQSLNDSLRAEIDTQVAKYFGLTGDAARKVSIEYGGVTVHTVKDLARVDLNTGESVIYEGLKVSSISVTYDNSLNAQIEATASAKRIPIESTAKGATQSTTTFTGTDLFVAFRVMQLEHGGTEVETKRLADDDFRFMVEDYEFEIEERPVLECFCADPERGPRIRVCMNEVDTPITVRNAKVVSVGGKVQEQVLLYREANANKPYPLAVRRQGDELVVTSARLNLWFHGVSDGVCLLQIIDEVSQLELTTTRMKLKPEWNPVAAGW